MYRKNVAGQHIGFAAINASTGAAMAGTTGFAAYRVIDGGTQASATGTVADKGNGQYDFALSQADTNGNDVSLLFTMSGMVPVEKTIVTEQLVATAVADAVLARDVSNVEATMPEHCLGTIVLATTEWAISGANWLIYRTDGVTTHATKPIATASGADSIVGVS